MTYTTRVDGIDCAHYQGQVDWPTVKAACANPSKAVAAFKVTQGINSIDPMKDRNRAETAKAGFAYRLGYHWLTAVVDPVAQADWFLAHFLAVEQGEGVILDAEESGITAAQCLAWCERVEATTGRPVAVYTGVHVAGGSIWHDLRIFNGQRPRWVAAYIPEAAMHAACAPFHPDVWQGDGGATGTFPGVAVGVDLNMVFNFAALDRACASTYTPGADMPVVVTNAEQFFTAPPNVWKAVIREDDGLLRHIEEPEWHAMGSPAGFPLTNAQIVAQGIWTPPPPTPPVVQNPPAPTSFSGTIHLTAP